jgi:hypothetical protein
MQNHKFLHNTMATTVAATLALCVHVAAVAQPSAPTVTVGEVLRLQQQDPAKAQQPKVERAKAFASLDAIYGNEQGLHFDVSLMGQASTGLKIGDLVKWGASSCRIKSYEPSQRCIALVPGSGSIICQPKACWTGVPMPTPTPIATGVPQATPQALTQSLSQALSQVSPPGSPSPVLVPAVVQPVPPSGRVAP